MSVESAVQNNVISTRLQRHKNGLLLKVKVAPEVEEFFKSFGQAAENVRDYGAAWLDPKDKPGEPAKVPLKAWCYRTNGNTMYDMESLGQLLQVVNRGRGIQLTNISFLRLVGASSDDGVSIVIDTIISFSEMKRLSDEITQACANFYGDYIKPVNFDTFIDSRPGIEPGHFS